MSTPSKRVKINEFESTYSGLEEIKFDSNLMKSSQRTWEIIVKTNRNAAKTTRKNDEEFYDNIQEFSWQAYLEPPSQIRKSNCSKSEGMQVDYRMDSTDKTTQSLHSLTTATSTQTFNEKVDRNSKATLTLPETTSDVSMQWNQNMLMGSTDQWVDTKIFISQLRSN